MSENEADWWLARSTKVPFLTEQVNISSSSYQNWLKKNYLDDEEAVANKWKEINESRNNA